MSDVFEKLVHVGRYAKVVKGGRRFRFGVIVVAGNQKGSAGYGTGGAAEVLSARSKASMSAKRDMVKIPLRDGRTLHHDVIGHFGSAKVVMRAAPAGTGIIAGGAVRALCEAFGIKDVVAKSIGSSNPHNILRAAMDALQSIRSPRYIAEKRGLKIGEIVSRRERFLKNISQNNGEDVLDAESSDEVALSQELGNDGN